MSHTKRAEVVEWVVGFFFHRVLVYFTVKETKIHVKMQKSHMFIITLYFTMLLLLHTLCCCDTFCHIFVTRRPARTELCQTNPQRGSTTTKAHLLTAVSCVVLRVQEFVRSNIRAAFAVLPFPLCWERPSFISSHYSQCTSVCMYCRYSIITKCSCLQCGIQWRLFSLKTGMYGHKTPLVFIYCIVSILLLYSLFAVCLFPKQDTHKRQEQGGGKHGGRKHGGRKHGGRKHGGRRRPAQLSPAPQPKTRSTCTNAQATPSLSFVLP